MKITRVIFEKGNPRSKSLATCSIVLDDCLKLTKIKLFHNEKGYYLVLPSKQDVYQEVEEINKGSNVSLPNNSGSKKYDEFFFPVESSFYQEMLDVILTGYSTYRQGNKEEWSYRV